MDDESSWIMVDPHDPPHIVYKPNTTTSHPTLLPNLIREAAVDTAWAAASYSATQYGGHIAYLLATNETASAMAPQLTGWAAALLSAKQAYDTRTLWWPTVRLVLRAATSSTSSKSS